MTMVHATVSPGARLDLPWDPTYNALAYVLSGHGTVGVEGAPVRTGNLAVLGAGDFVTLAADERQDSRTPALDVVVMGGRPIREPVAWAGPFVMNTKAEVLQAWEDFQKGRLGTIPSVHGAPTTIQEG
jgi:redox-sensitive bicupin YhaK (pirin superfamily)